MDETQLTLAGDPAAGLREVSWTRRVRFLWTDSTDRHSDLCSYPLSLGSVLRCHSCQTVLMAVVHAGGRHRLGLLRNRNADARNRKQFRSSMAEATNNYWTYPAHPLWRLQSCRQPAVDYEVGASDISCPDAG